MFGTYGNIGNADHDYEYIGVFIDFLERIIDLIIKLFNGIGGGSSDTTTTTAPSSEA